MSITRNTVERDTTPPNNAIHNDTAGVGEGLGMFSNYKVISDLNPFGDCGLREYNTPFPKRPLWSTWTNMNMPAP